MCRSNSCPSRRRCSTARWASRPTSTWTPAWQYNITLKDCGYDLPGPHDIWVAVDMSVLYGLGNPGGEPPLPPAHPDKKTDSCQVNSGV